MTTHRLSRFDVAALLAGPVVTLAGMATTPWESEATTASYQAALAAHETQAQVAALLLVFGYALMGLTAFTVLRLTRDVVRKALWIPAAVLAFLGATILPGMVLVDFYDLALAKNLPANEAVRVADAVGEYHLALIGRIPAVAGMVLGGILLGFVAWRGRIAGAWMPVLLLAGMLAPIAIQIPAAPVISSVFMVVAYAALVVVQRRRAAVPATLTPVPATA